MDSLRKTALCLLFLSISLGASDSKDIISNCTSIKTEYNKTAVISCNSSKKITDVVVKHCESCAKENSCFKMVINTLQKIYLSEDGRIQLKLHNDSAEVHIQKVKATDRGDYKWYVYVDGGEDYGCTTLEITAPETEPNLTWNRTELACLSPIGHQQRQIHWFDGHGTNLTGRASLVAEEVEDGLTSLTSTLHESPNLTASGYCCVVVYDVHTKRNKTKCLNADTVEDYLRFTSNPDVTQEPAILMVHEGESVNITCSITNNGKLAGMYLKRVLVNAMEVLYIRNNRENHTVSLHYKTRIESTVLSTGVRIMLHWLQKNDSDLYVCQGSVLVNGDPHTVSGQGTMLVVKDIEQAECHMASWVPYALFFLTLLFVFVLGFLILSHVDIKKHCQEGKKNQANMVYEDISLSQ